MIPSQEEISAGQKAYQGLKAYERFRISQRSKLSMFLSVVAVLFLFVQILAYIYGGKYWMATWGAAVFVILPWGWHAMENTKRKNFELLQQLKAKYGSEIYEEITKDPNSLQYQLFQKSYPPDKRPPFIELP